MKSLLAWWREWRQIQQERQEDAEAYSRLLGDIQDLCVWCADFPETEAAAYWLLHRDHQRRWKPGDAPISGAPYWGPIGTFRDQLVVRRTRQRQR